MKNIETDYAFSSLTGEQEKLASDMYTATMKKFEAVSGVVCVGSASEEVEEDLEERRPN